MFIFGTYFVFSGTATNNSNNNKTKKKWLIFSKRTLNFYTFVSRVSLCKKKLHIDAEKFDHNTDSRMYI